jgi:hypothetical protein
MLAGIACGAGFAASAAGPNRSHASPSAYVPAKLLSAAQRSPNRNFRVILQGARAVPAVRQSGATLERSLRTISGASAAVTGRQIVSLASTRGVAAITLDRPVRLTDDGGDGSGRFWSDQQWPYAVRAQKDWHEAAKGKLPTAAWGSAAWGSAAWGSAAWGSSALAQQLASSDAAWGSAAWGAAAMADVAPDISLPAALVASAKP